MSRNSADPPDSDRRPLKSRGQRWAQQLAGTLVKTGISPNTISALSVVAACFCLLLLWMSVLVDGGLRALCYFMAAFACQLRLLCNLMDGMVAIEGGRHSADGPLWNEFPDRVADVAILVGLGIAADALVTGWVAATLAVAIAYVRELGKGLDGHVDFSGPMAKPQRMALVTGVLVLAALLQSLPFVAVNEAFAVTLLKVGLWVCIAGSVVTLWRRTRAIQRRLLRS